MSRRGPAVDDRLGSTARPVFAESWALASVLDQMPVGILLVDRAARVIWMNLSAGLLVQGGDGLELRDARLVAASRGQAHALACAVRRALDAGEVGAPGDPEAVMLRRSSGSAPLVVVCRPLESPDRGPAEPQAKAVIFVSDPGHGLRTNRKRLRQLFDLTPAEAELAALLAEGKDVREAAARLGISEETARTHVKRAFQKTGVRRQAELVRLALAAATAGAIES